MRSLTLFVCAACVAGAALLHCTGDDPELTPPSDAGVDDAPVKEAGSSVDASSGDASCDLSAVMTDPNNCGACGHECLGAKCTGGKCESMVLASNQTQPTTVTVADGTLYWAWHDGTIRSCEVASCATTTKELAAPDTRVDGGYSGASTYTETLLVDATHLYWAAYYTGYIFRCARAGCSGTGPEKWMARPSLAAPTGLAMDGTRVYWTDQSGIQGVWSCLKGPSCVPVFVAKSEPIFPRSIAVGGVNDTLLYWVSAGQAGEPPGTLSQVAKDAADAAASTTQDKIVAPTSLVATQVNVYYTSDGDGGASGAIFKGLAANQAGAQLFATGLDRPTSITLDSTRVYWAESGGGRVMSCPRSGCGAGPTVLASGEDEPYGLAVDDRSVYWTTRSGGEIKRIAK